MQNLSNHRETKNHFLLYLINITPIFIGVIRQKSKNMNFLIILHSFLQTMG